MHKTLESVPEEKEAVPEPLATPHSQIHQQDLAGSPTVEKASLPPLKPHSKPIVEAVLKKIKPQVSVQIFFVINVSCDNLRMFFFSLFMETNISKVIW